MFMRENAKQGIFSMKNAITSSFSLKDLLYINELFLAVTDPDEHSALIHVAPPLYRAGEKEVQLLDYGCFPPMDAPALQGPLCSQLSVQYLFTVTFLASKVVLLPAAALAEQWHWFEFVCKAITAYQDYIVIVPHSGVPPHLHRRHLASRQWRDELNHQAACCLV